MTEVDRSEADRLTEVADQVADSARLQRRAATLVRRMAAQRRRGRPWRSIVTSSTPRRTLELLGEAGRRLRHGARQLRQLLVGGLSAEGSTTRQIGELFEVSHQRISVILRTRHQDTRHQEQP